MVFPRATPALLMRIVGLPRESRMAEAVEAMAEGEERSHLKKWTDGGAVKVVRLDTVSEFGVLEDWCLLGTYPHKSYPAHPTRQL